LIPVGLSELGGVTFVGGDAGVVIEGVVCDSRAATSGSLFVCLRGSRCDGHDFVVQAARRGAVAVMCERGRGRSWPGLAVFETDDPLSTLGVLANLVRRRSEATVVGVAGSAGKTTTKDVLYSLLAPVLPTVASPASFNNMLGVSLTLSLLETATRVCVCELGTSGPGDLAAVCGVAEPDCGILTAVGPEHLDGLGSLIGVAAAQAELIAALGPGSPLVLQHGEPLLEGYRRRELDEWTFGLDDQADVQPLEWRRACGSTEVTLSVRGATIAFTTNLGQPQQRLNMCAAVAAYAALGLPLERIREGAAVIELSPWRGEEHRFACGGVLINDAYNANPLSMSAALEALVLERAGARRAVAILGDMAELGGQSKHWHESIGEKATVLGVDLLIAIGPLAKGYLAGAEARIETCWFPDREAAAVTLPRLLRAGDAVLLKGSRVVGLERLTDAVLGALANTSSSDELLTEPTSSAGRGPPAKVH
jgi:UDP-N-acetylmuramoyl-tripeptide--D-alanyl-D-alanine ligase